jgi:hypothetical protein
MKESSGDFEVCRVFLRKSHYLVIKNVSVLILGTSSNV